MDEETPDEKDWLEGQVELLTEKRRPPVQMRL
jgi:hypothetical protein